MADDSELDYLKTLFENLCPDTTIKTISEIRNINLIKDNSRILIFPSELINVDGKFFKKRFKIQYSDLSETRLNIGFNLIVNGIDIVNKDSILRTYRGVESFSFELEGTADDDIDFVDITSLLVGAGCTLTIDVEEDGHNKVLKLYDNGAGQIVFYHTLSTFSSTTGTIEFWIKTSDGTKEIEFAFMTILDNVASKLKIDSGKLQYNDGAWHDVTGGAITNDTWTHLRFIFDTTARTFDVYFNTILKQADIPFWLNPTSIEKFRFLTNTTDSGYTIYFDGFGYSWDDNYNVGDNYSTYSRPSILAYIELKYGSKAFEHPKTKRWHQDIYLDVEWCIA